MKHPHLPHWLPLCAALLASCSASGRGPGGLARGGGGAGEAGSGAGVGEAPCPPGQRWVEGACRPRLDGGEGEGEGEGEGVGGEGEGVGGEGEGEGEGEGIGGQRPCPGQGQARCDGVCTDVSRDPVHCGACDVACGPAEPVCEGGSCVARCEPAREVCDGRDNDCDAEIDEDDPDLGGSCDTGSLGPCWQGRKRCVEASLSCVAVVDPYEEICDGVDNDCDGEADEGRPESNEVCDAEVVGECGFGLTRCEDGFLWCDALDPSAEVCDGLDNDCDGSVDEAVEDEPLPEVGESCETGGVGACGLGGLSCEGGELECLQLNEAVDEVCDGLDNDCDGVADEDDGQGECPPAEPATFEYTGAVQVWEVPATARYLVEAWGAEGGTGPGTSPDRDGVGGLGGRAWGAFDLRAGEELRIYVGGAGGRGPNEGGFNGGGAAGQYGGGGGGASDVRRGGEGWEHRIVVAGGGGGGNGGSPLHGRGGVGGGLQGGDGIAVSPSWQPGRGASQEAGGGPGSQGRAGALGQGAGNAAYHHSGGGGGWYGGGQAYASGAGGGSSHFGPALDGTGGTEAGARQGAGHVEIRPAP